MRVAYIVGSFPAPSQTFVANQIFGIQNSGQEVSIFTCDRCDENKSAMEITNRTGIQICSICPPKNYAVRLFNIIGLLFLCGWRSPRVVVRSLNVFQHGHAALSLWLLHASLTLVRVGERKFDVVHAQFGKYGLYAMKLIQIDAIHGALVTSFRGYDATSGLRIYAREYAELFKKGRLFLPVSESLANILIGAGCASSKIHVLHSGINCEQLTYKDPRRDDRQPIRLVTVGRLVEKKGVHFALDAAARVINSGREIVYTIVGDGPLRGEIERLIKEYGIGKHVELLGWMSHQKTMSILQSSTILITPSITAGDGDQEGIPNVIKEAMAVGLPVISTAHAGIPELVKDGETGFLVPERRADLLADKINNLYDHPEILPPITRAARTEVVENFEIGRLTKELLAHYSGLIKGRDNYDIGNSPAATLITKVGEHGRNRPDHRASGH